MGTCNNCEILNEYPHIVVLFNTPQPQNLERKDMVTVKTEHAEGDFTGISLYCSLRA